MSKFETGDIIRYITEPASLRAVLEVDDAADRYVVTDDTLPTTSDQTWRDSQPYFDGYYELVYRPAVDASKVADAHVADMATLSRKLAAEARSRGWCPEYQNIIGSWNDELTVKLEAYPTTTLTTTATIIVNVSRTEEVPSGDSYGPADRAYAHYWSDDITDVSVPGWTVDNVRRDGHTFATA